MLRSWTKNDLNAILELEKQCFKEPWSYEMLESEMNLKGFVGLVLEENGEILGYVGASTILDEGNIDVIAVAPSMRKKGYGKLILSELLNKLFSNGITKVFLEVRRKNLPARSLYENLGFITIGERLNYYGDDDAIIMVKLNGVEL